MTAVEHLMYAMRCLAEQADTRSGRSGWRALAITHITYALLKLRLAAR